MREKTAVLPTAGVKLWIVLLALIMILVWIFEMSDRPAQESQSMSGQIDRWLCEIFVKDYNELTYEEQQRIMNTLDFGVRKSAHFLEYTVLGSVLYLALGFVFKRRKIQIAAVFFAGALQAALDEFHQYFVAGRNSQLADVFLDTFGVCMGVLLMLLWSYFLKADRKNGCKEDF